MLQIFLKKCEIVQVTQGQNCLRSIVFFDNPSLIYLNTMPHNLLQAGLFV